MTREPLVDVRIDTPFQSIPRRDAVLREAIRAALSAYFLPSADTLTDGEVTILLNGRDL